MHKPHHLHEHNLRLPGQPWRTGNQKQGRCHTGGSRPTRSRTLWSQDHHHPERLRHGGGPERGLAHEAPRAAAAPVWPRTTQQIRTPRQAHPTSTAVACGPPLLILDPQEMAPPVRQCEGPCCHRCAGNKAQHGPEHVIKQHEPHHGMAINKVGRHSTARCLHNCHAPPLWCLRTGRNTEVPQEQCQSSKWWPWISTPGSEAQLVPHECSACKEQE
mmetsp:Transcript_48474/g.140407  ORF Transcript_48474/g.140407 Transcript_48474/m.140407 type:complete len:216 (-) Transcript_48474:296-943(-)